MLLSARAIGSAALEWWRYLVERLILMPAADLLPKRIALRIADAVGIVEVSIPCSASRTARREVAAALGAHGMRQHVAAAQRLAGPRRDLVVLRRLRRGRERPRDWHLIWEGGDAVRTMLAEQRGFVIASGHFHHSADLVLTDAVIPQLAGKSLPGKRPAWRPSPRALRERLQTGLLYGLACNLLGLPETFLPFVGEGGTVSAMLDVIRQPAGVVRIYIDAIWEKPHAYRRPFAGLAVRGFAVGAARVARLAQCPVVLCVPLYENDGSVRLVWGEPIEPPSVDDLGADMQVIDALVNSLELVVGRYPLQYLHPMGWERAWNPSIGRWEPELDTVPR